MEEFYDDPSDDVCEDCNRKVGPDSLKTAYACASGYYGCCNCTKKICTKECVFTCSCGEKKKSENVSLPGWHRDGKPGDKFSCDHCGKKIEFTWHGMSPSEYERRM